MRITELLRLVWLNINQNKFKSVMTSIGIVVGAATIVMVIGIGRGGQMNVAEQFSSLNAGAIDISYEYEGSDAGSGSGFSFGGNGGFSIGGFSFGGGSMQSMGGRSSMRGGSSDSSDASGSLSGSFPGENMGDFTPGDSSSDGDSPSENMPDMSERFGGRYPDGNEAGGSEKDKNGTESENQMEPDSENQSADNENSQQETETEEDFTADRINQENIILTAEDVEDIELFVSGITGATISYSTRGSVEGGNLTEAQTYTIAGGKASYGTLSNLELAAGTFITEEEDYTKARVCVLGSSVAKELFGSVIEAYDSTIFIDDRAYVVNGVLESTGTVSAGISPDESIFIPYQTGIKYITGEKISPVITVIAEDVNALDSVISDVHTVLRENYNNAEFTFSDAGSKMEAAESSNEILTLLLAAMAAIVFIVGGIGIMNVLFVSVKERTGEIGILKSLGASRSIILFEFLLESASISLMGGVLGVGASFLVTPVVEHYGIRVEANTTAWAAALGFAVLTGTVFGIYPAWKASRLEPVEALNATE